MYETMATQEQIKQAKHDFSLINEDEWRKMPHASKTEGIIGKAKALGIRSYYVPGREKPIPLTKTTRKTKPFLVDLILEILSEYRKARRAERVPGVVNQSFYNLDSKELLCSTYAKFEHACEMYFTHQDLESLAVECSALGATLANQIKTIPHYKTGLPRSPHSHISDYRDFFKDFEKLVAEEGSYKKIMSKMLPIFKRGATYAFKDEFAYKQKDAVRKEQEVRQQAVINVEVSNYLSWAKITLENVSNAPRGYWKKVVIALALVTGRRQNELLCTATKFELINENWVWFTGQSKTKTYSGEFFDKFPAFAIPTLVSAQLVIDGFEYLKSQNKLIEPTERKLINKRYNSDIGTIFRGVKSETGIPPELTFHENRDLYAQLASKISAIPEVYETIPNADKFEADYICYLLGEGRAVYEYQGKKFYQLQKNLAFLRYQDKYKVV